MINLDKLILNNTKHLGTAFMHESGFWVPAVSIEEYQVSYQGILVATFWVSNASEDSIQLHQPMDIKILNHILKLYKTRQFKRNNGEA